MDTERINKWISLLANIGVLVGIVFLAVEVRQSNRIAIATTEISVRNQFKTNNELVLADDAIAELLVKATDSNAKFSAVESEKLYALFYAYINTWTSIEIAYKNGMVQRETMDVVLNDVRNTLRFYPAFHPLVRETFVLYPAETDYLVQETMREELADTD